jgi:citrate lyase subunit beta/citryl-CoA lyase
MTARSYLFAPGDSERKMQKAAASGTDAIIFDLEDSVATERKTTARDLVRTLLMTQRQAANTPELWVRINPLSTEFALNDLAAIICAKPDGIVLPKAVSGADVVKLDHYVSALEAAAGLVVGAVRIFAVVTETPMALFGLGTYGGVSPRLAAMTWGAEDLSAGLGASTNRDADDSLAFTYRLARSLCLAGAKAAGVAAIDTLWTNFRDLEGLEHEAIAARREGFAGKIAIHPDQIAVINKAFTPTEKEIEAASRIVAAFESSPGAGTIGLDGRMLDLPHLNQARAMLAAAERYIARQK